MIYGFALLFFLLALVTGIPALRNLLRMRQINKNAGSTTGYVASMGNALGWLWTSDFGNVARPNIKYESPSGKEMAIEVVTGNMFTVLRYEQGMAVEVVFDRSAPWDAYARPEWMENLKDLWIGLGGLVLSIALVITGRIFGL